MASTTVQLSQAHRDVLASMKLHPRESFDEVVGRILEDLQELDRTTVRAVARARAEIAEGRSHTHEQVKAKLGF